MASRYKKGDLVIVDVAGKPVEFEITSHLISSNRDVRIRNEDVCYEARDVANGVTRTIYEDEILRLATPVDNSAQLFQRASTNTKK